MAKKRAKSLLIPYISWGLLISALVVCAASIGLPGSTPQGPKNLVLGGAWLTGWYATFWFVTCLFVASGAYNFLRHRYAAASISMTVVMALTLPFGVLMAPHRLPLSLNVVPVALVFLWLGEIFRNHRPTPAIALTSAVIGAIGLSLTAPLDLKFGKLGTPVFSLVVAAAICYTLLWLCTQWTKKAPIPKILDYLSRSSLVIMFAHASIYITLRQFISPIFVFVITTILAVSCYWLINKTGPHGRRLLIGGRK